MSEDLKRIVEALLFVAETPLSLGQLCQVLESKERAPVREAIDQLQSDYQENNRAFELVQVAGGYTFRTRPDLAFWLRRLRKQQVTRLSKAALETLAIVAYKQPVMRAEVERIRGVDVGGILRTLMEKGLVKVAGRKDLPGRPLIYGTTRRFLEVFDLKDLKDLPTLEEVEGLAQGQDGLPLDDGDLPLLKQALEDEEEAPMNEDGEAVPQEEDQDAEIGQAEPEANEETTTQDQPNTDQAPRPEAQEPVPSQPAELAEEDAAPQDQEPGPDPGPRAA